MDWWTKIRLELRHDETSKREMMRREGIRWDPLQKIMTHSEPPGYRMSAPRPKPKLGPYPETIVQTIPLRFFCLKNRQPL